MPLCRALYGTVYELCCHALRPSPGPPGAQPQGPCGLLPSAARRSPRLANLWLFRRPTPQTVYPIPPVKQSIHLTPVEGPSAEATPRPIPAAIELESAPQWLCGPADQTQVQPAALTAGKAPDSAALVEPVPDPSNRLGLLVHFPEGSTPTVNGEPGLSWALLAPGDMFQWHGGDTFRVLLFNKPLIGPPAKAAVGKRCPICRVPITEGTTTVTCLCGAVIHCEPDGPEALQCAQLSSACPVCHRPVALTEGYITPGTED